MSTEPGKVESVFELSTTEALRVVRLAVRSSSLARRASISPSMYPEELAIKEGDESWG